VPIIPLKRIACECGKRFGACDFMEVLDGNSRPHPDRADQAVTIYVLPSRVTSWWRRRGSNFRHADYGPKATIITRSFTDACSRLQARSASGRWQLATQRQSQKCTRSNGSLHLNLQIMLACSCESANTPELSVV